MKLSPRTLSDACVHAANIYELSLDENNLERILHTSDFREIKKLILAELPNLTDQEILGSVMKEYSKRLLTV